MTEAPIVMSFTFHQFIFEFRADGEIFITDRQWKKRWRLMFTGDSDLNFTLQLLEKDVKI